MNLNEAAEIVNKSDRTWLKQNLPPNELRAYVKLANTTLSELDPTPISEEWLRENGWVIGSGNWWLIKQQQFMVMHYAGCVWVFESNIINGEFRTLGELRTLLRLCGGVE